MKITWVHIHRFSQIQTYFSYITIHKIKLQNICHVILPIGTDALGKFTISGKLHRKLEQLWITNETFFNFFGRAYARQSDFSKKKAFAVLLNWFSRALWSYKGSLKLKVHSPLLHSQPALWKKPMCFSNTYKNRRGAFVLLQWIFDLTLLYSQSLWCFSELLWKLVF